MIIKVRFYDFERAFVNQERTDSFSYAGKKALFEYLESIEDENNQMELDVVGLCGDYSEYEDIEDYNRQTNEEYEDVGKLEDTMIVIKIENSDGFIVQE